MKRPADISNARILVTNDDGIYAQGITILAEIAAEMSQDVWVCAPASEQSASSHALTMHRPLRLRQVDRRKFTVDGTPTDCVLLGVHEVLQDKKPDLILSGLNQGANIADGVAYSGTIAAAMEGTMLGIPSFALSQQSIGDGPVNWSVARLWAPRVIKTCLECAWPEDVFININFPAVTGTGEVKGVKVVRHGKQNFTREVTSRLDQFDRKYYWIGGGRQQAEYPEGTDLQALADGYISVTALTLDTNHTACNEALAGLFQK